MPLVVPCPGCPAKLSAPESAAGKRIRCPKCKAVVTVPAFIPAEEVSVIEAKVASPPPEPESEATETKPRTKTDTTVTCCIGCNSMVCVLGKVKVVHCPKCGFANPVRPQPGAAETEDEEDSPPPKSKIRRDEDDEEDERPCKKKRRPAYDDDDEADERPRRKRRRPAASRSGGGGSGGRVAILVLGGLILLGGLGFGAYLLVGKGGVFAKKSPVPTGWKEYSYPQSGFKAAFPSEPAVFGANMQGGFGGGQLPGGVEIPQIESTHSYTTGRFDRGVRVTVEVNRYRTPIPRASRDLVTRNGNSRFAGAGLRRVRWLGGDAIEMDVNGMLMRLAVLEKAVIVAQISGPNGARATPEEENGFFDNFELIN